jgi:ABC-type histidine transport system ATPase subunit
MFAPTIRIGGFDKSRTSVLSVGAAGSGICAFPRLVKVRAKERADKIQVDQQEIRYFIRGAVFPSDVFSTDENTLKQGSNNKLYQD